MEFVSVGIKFLKMSSNSILVLFFENTCTFWVFWTNSIV